MIFSSRFIVSHVKWFIRTTLYLYDQTHYIRKIETIFILAMPGRGIQDLTAKTRLPPNFQKENRPC